MSPLAPIGGFQPAKVAVTNLIGPLKCNSQTVCPSFPASSSKCFPDGDVMDVPGLKGTLSVVLELRLNDIDFAELLNFILFTEVKS